MKKKISRTDSYKNLLTRGQSDRERGKESDREWETQKKRVIERERHRKRETQKERGIERERNGQRERQRRMLSEDKKILQALNNYF